MPAGQFDLDLAQFERHAAEGRLALAAGRLTSARESLRTALSLWRGQALSGVTDHLAAVEQPRLEEARLTALEDRVEADLALGEHALLLAELTALTANEPLRERPRAQLMLALHRCGRTADALNAYHKFRQILAEDLGLDPSPELQELHQSILTGDPELQLSGPSILVRPKVPRAVLPPEPRDFTGRAGESARICAMLTAPAEADEPPSVCAITGASGVGKTTLAMHVARRLVECFTGPQILLDLGGSRPVPPEPAELLRRALEILGVEPHAIPQGADELAAVYRDRLTGTRALLLLDDAADERQLRPLVPGVAGCGVLVTSRARLATLEGTDRIELGGFGAGEAEQLLGKIIGAERVAAEQRAAERIAEICDRLPLAVRINGARLVARPHWSLARLIDRLSDETHLLDELCLADLDVGAGLAAAYKKLGTGSHEALLTMFRSAPPSFTTWTTARLLGLSSRDAEDVLEELIDARLLVIDPADTGRYRFPNLVRAFTARLLAQEAARSQSSPPTRNDLEEMSRYPTNVLVLLGSSPNGIGSPGAAPSIPHQAVTSWRWPRTAGGNGLPVVPAAGGNGLPSTPTTTRSAGEAFASTDTTGWQ